MFIPKLKKILTSARWLSVFVIIFSALVLTLTLRGVPGNPTPAQIRTQLRETTRPFELSPERGRYALTMSLANNHALEFSRDIAGFAVPDLGYTKGRFVSLFAPGVSLAAVPFYLFGKFLHLAQVATFSLSALMAVVNLILISAIVYRLTRQRLPGLIAGMTFLFASTSWPYAVTLYQHHLTTALLLFCFYLLTYPSRWFTTFSIALFSGLSLLIDYPNVVFFAPIALYTGLRYFRISSSDHHRLLAIDPGFIFALLGALIAFLPFSLYHQQAYGSPLSLAGTAHQVKFINQLDQPQLLTTQAAAENKTALGFFQPQLLPHSLAILVTSEEKGFIWFSPVILLALLGIAPLFRRYPSLSRVLISTIAAVFLLYGMWGDPWGGWAYGPRYLIPALAGSAVFLGIALTAFGRRLWFALLFFITTGYGLLVNLLGALTTNQIPPSSEAEFANYPQPIFLHCLHLVNQGITGSFVYQTYLSGLISLPLLAAFLFTSIFIAISALYFLWLRSLSISPKTSPRLSPARRRDSLSLIGEV